MYFLYFKGRKTTVLIVLAQMFGFGLAMFRYCFFEFLFNNFPLQIIYDYQLLVFRNVPKRLIFANSFAMKLDNE